MVHVDEQTADCVVLTRKEGLMAAVGHDLRLQVTRLTLDITDDWTGVDARFDLASLRVVTAVKDGVDTPEALSPADKLKIEETVRDTVLHTDSHPEAHFFARRITRNGPAVVVTGDLTLHGKTHGVTARGALQGTRWTLEATLHQPHWGITPYRAMLGALRIKDDVTVRVSVPAVAP